MAIPKFKPLAQASGGTKNIIKVVLIGALALLLGAFGLEAFQTDFDLGKLISGSGLEESKVTRDSSGNIFYDKLGNVTSDSSAGKKASDYNCDDFANQPEAQNFFQKVGGVNNDLYRLDGDKDSNACESLPKGK